VTQFLILFPQFFFRVNLALSQVSLDTLFSILQGPIRSDCVEQSFLLLIEDSTLSSNRLIHMLFSGFVEQVEELFYLAYNF
jgi:hypothetical protein